MLVVIEVADSSLAYDRAVKRSLYARRGIPEFWIVDVATGEVEVCRVPSGDQYVCVTRVGPDGILAPTLPPGVTISVAALLV